VRACYELGLCHCDLSHLADCGEAASAAGCVVCWVGDCSCLVVFWRVCVRRRVLRLLCTCMLLWGKHPTLPDSSDNVFLGALPVKRRVRLTSPPLAPFPHAHQLCPAPVLVSLLWCVCPHTLKSYLSARLGLRQQLCGLCQGTVSMDASYLHEQ
jgi:hypothetical protein